MINAWHRSNEATVVQVDKRTHLIHRRAGAAIDGGSAFEPSPYQRQFPTWETQFSRAETKTPKRPLQFNGQIAETNGCTNRRQFGAIRTEPGNPLLRTIQPNGYCRDTSEPGLPSLIYRWSGRGSTRCLVFLRPSRTEIFLPFVETLVGSIVQGSKFLEVSPFRARSQPVTNQLCFSLSVRASFRSSIAYSGASQTHFHTEDSKLDHPK
jgi:hypothetical protein